MAHFSRCAFNSIVAVLCVVLFGATPATTAPSVGSAMLYLAQYGYMEPNHLNSSKLIQEGSFNNAIAEFQNFAGLNVTGELDDVTVKTMQLPRCGVKDKIGIATERSKRYALQGSRWKVKNLTFRVSKYPRQLKKPDVDRTLQAAFDVWSEYTDLKFTHQRTSSQVHIEIRFEQGEHGDGDPFDGPGGTLAHAFFPVFGGDAHFDADEHWTIDTYSGTNLFQVAAHEFGHSLGLSHSDVRTALMAPFYRGYEPSFTLDIDDIQGIQALYGKKTRYDKDRGNKGGDDDSFGNGVPNFKPRTPPSNGGGGGNGGGNDALLCRNAKMDTIFNARDGATYVFKGKYYWRLTEDAIAAGYPKQISTGWPGLPGNMDAAFTYKNGKTYFFKGRKYWRYVDRKMDGAYPKDISEGFAGVPDDLDAAMVWSGNGKIYFFKGAKFWRFDPSQRPPVKSTYPKPISNWQGLPDHLDAAFQYTNGYTYFYKDGAYYRFNDRLFAVDPTNPAFPRSTAYWWYGCSGAPKGTIATSDVRNNIEAEEGADYDTGNQSSGGDDVFDAGPHQDGGTEGSRSGTISFHSNKNQRYLVLLLITIAAIGRLTN